MPHILRNQSCPTAGPPTEAAGPLPGHSVHPFHRARTRGRTETGGEGYPQIWNCVPSSQNLPQSPMRGECGRRCAPIQGPGGDLPAPPICVGVLFDIAKAPGRVPFPRSAAGCLARQDTTSPACGWLSRDGGWRGLSVQGGGAELDVGPHTGGQESDSPWYGICR